MDRRKLIKGCLTAIPFSALAFKGLPADSVVGATLPHRSLLFVDVDSVDMESFNDWPADWPNIDGFIIPVRVKPGMTIHDAVKLINIEEGEDASKDTEAKS